MNVIGLDIATKTGIALGEPGAKPLCWTESLGNKDSGHAERFAQMLRTAHRLISKYEPGLVAIETPIVNSRRDKTSTNILLMGLVGCARGLIHDRGVPTIMVSTGEIDKHFLGGRQPKGERKGAIARRCKMLGWDFSGQDEADAAAVWSLACSTMSRSHGISTTPLFQGR